MDYQAYDLHFTQRGMTPVSPRGMEFVHSVLLRGPLFAPRDYRDATQQGLHVSFETSADLDRVTQPSWTPTEQPAFTGYADEVLPEVKPDLPDECQADDNADEAICEDAIYPANDPTQGA